MAWISGVGLTPFGRLPGTDAIGWQERAAVAALEDASLRPADIDGLLVGYATTLNHLMPANLLAERLGIVPDMAAGMNVGGATGLAMMAHAARLVDAGSLNRVLVVAGEDRSSGQSREHSTSTLAQVGHREYEVPLGGTVPAYYALIASEYLHRYGLTPAALAPLAVTMRRHAGCTEGAHRRTPIEAADVLSSREIAPPLRLLDCCPVSDGGAALVVTANPGRRPVAIAGIGQAHRHQHIVEMDLTDVGARRSAQQALTEAGVGLENIALAGIYDSFTVTLAILLEEIGFAAPGGAGAAAASGAFDRRGRLPLNLHGGLLAYGHPGVAGGMAHVVDVVSRLSEPPSRYGFVHADGGVLSAHVSAVLRSEAVA